MVKGLPADAAIGRQLPDAQVWTHRDELAATQAEVADRWGRSLYALLRQVHGKGRPPRLPDPLVIDHPARTELRERAQQTHRRERRTVSLADAVARIRR